MALIGQTPRYTQLTAAMQKIASFDASYINYVQQIYGYNDGDDAIFIIPAQGVNGGGGFAVLRADSTGAFQWWQTADYAGGQYNFDTNHVPFPLGGASFYMPYFNGLNLISVPSFKGNGKSIIAPPVMSLTNSCVGGAPTNVFFDPDQSLLACEWIVPFQFASDFYCTIYKVKGVETSVVASGFVGSSAGDPFNLTEQYSFLYNQGVELTNAGSIYGKNGLLYGTNVTVTSSQYYQTAFSKTRVHAGGIGTCDVNNGPTTDSYVYTEASNRVYGVPNGFVASSLIPAGSGIPNTGAWSDNINAIILMDTNGNVTRITPSTGMLSNGLGGLTIDAYGNIFALVANTNAGPLDLYYGKVQLAGLNGLNLNKGNLRNMARPVSVMGRWQA